jgi:hypothetical protein
MALQREPLVRGQLYSCSLSYCSFDLYTLLCHPPLPVLLEAPGQVPTSVAAAQQLSRPHFVEEVALGRGPRDTNSVTADSEIAAFAKTRSRGMTSFRHDDATEVASSSPEGSAACPSDDAAVLRPFADKSRPQWTPGSAAAASTAPDSGSSGAAVPGGGTLLAPVKPKHGAKAAGQSAAMMAQIADIAKSSQSAHANLMQGIERIAGSFERTVQQILLQGESSRRRRSGRSRSRNNERSGGRSHERGGGRSRSRSRSHERGEGLSEERGRGSYRDRSRSRSRERDRISASASGRSLAQLDVSRSRRRDSDRHGERGDSDSESDRDARNYHARGRSDSLS